MSERIFHSDDKSPKVNIDLYNETSPEDELIICLSQRDVFIIRSYLWPFVEWPTRLIRPIDRGRWEQSTEAELNGFIETCHQLDGKLTRGDFMACLEDGLNNIANALMAMANKPCCGDGVDVTVNGGVVSEWVDGEGIHHPIYGSSPTKTNDGSTPPEGFETYEEYQLNKCQVSNLVFDGWILSMRGLAGLTIFNSTALATLIGLAIPGIIVLPEVAIPVMIGALVVLGSFVVMFNEICDSLEENRESIICDLYTSDTVETMTSILADALDLAIEGLDALPVVGDSLRLVALTLVNSDTLSQLMSGIAGVSYPDADCTACGETFITLDAGNEASRSFNSSTGEWEFEGTGQGGFESPAVVRVSYNRGAGPSFMVSGMITDCMGSTIPGAGFVYGYYYDLDATIHYMTSSPNDMAGIDILSFALYGTDVYSYSFSAVEG